MILRLTIYGLLVLTLGLALFGCAAATAPVSTDPAAGIDLRQLPDGPTDVHVTARGILIDLHVTDAYPFCLETPTDYACVTAGDLRAWLRVQRRAEEWTPTSLEGTEVGR